MISFFRDFLRMAECIFKEAGPSKERRGRSCDVILLGTGQMITGGVAIAPQPH